MPKGLGLLSLLLERLEAHAARQMHLGDTPPGHEYALGAVRALTFTGDISTEEAAGWLRRFDAAAGSHGADKPVSTNARLVQTVTGDHAVTGRPVDVPAKVRDKFELGSFVKAVVAPATRVPYRNGELQLVSLELFRPGVILRWLFELPDSLSSGIAAVPSKMSAQAQHEQLAQAQHGWFLQIGELAPHFTMVDDLGNQYLETAARWQGTSTIRGETEFVPGFLDDAHLLFLSASPTANFAVLVQ